MSKQTQRLSRRNFLLTAGATSAAAAAAIVAKSSNPAQPAQNKDKRATRGYKLSEHVNNYYRTTKV